MSVTFSAKAKPITTGPKAGDVGLIGAASTSGIPRDTSPRGDHAARRARQYIHNIPTAAERSALTLENPEWLESKDPLAAALASVVARFDCPSLTPSASRPRPANEKLARTKVKKW